MFSSLDDARKIEAWRAFEVRPHTAVKAAMLTLLRAWLHAAEEADCRPRTHHMVGHCGGL
jgi:hypothetical protein